MDITTKFQRPQYITLYGEPFCDDKPCRLFNVHCPDELIKAQLNGGHEFCPRHQEILESINRSV